MTKPSHTVASRAKLEGTYSVKPVVTVELTVTASGNPPGVSGMAVARSSLWARVNGGPWLEVGATRSWAKAKELIEWALELDPQPPQASEDGQGDGDE